MDINAISQALSNAFMIVIVSSLIVAVGFGLIGGLAWLYIWIGKWVMVYIRKAYADALEVAGAEVKNGKRQAAKG